MTVINLNAFVGEQPVRDTRLLNDASAVSAVNVRTDGGKLKPVNAPALLAAASGNTRSVFRIPTGNAGDVTQSFWMRFADRDTDVFKSPAVNDSFERYYWASPTEGMRFNTKARILAGLPSYKLGVTPPGNAPTVFVDPLTGTQTIIPESGKFDAAKYIVDNPDLSDSFIAVGAAYSYEHWVTIGIANGVEAPLTPSGQFDANAYNATVPGLAAEANLAIERATIDHWTLTGKYEGRGYPYVDGTEEYSHGLMVTRSYVYTYINIYGEESAPSPPAEGAGAVDQTWRITVATRTTDAGRAPIDKIRIYRTVTAASGSTVFQKVVDISSSQTSYNDTQTDSIVSAGAQLQSTLWAVPLEGIEGMIAMPNGIFVAFKGQNLYFSENYRPHAWPAEYTLTVTHPVVGLGVFGNSCAVCTTGHPAVVSGVKSSSMQLVMNNVAKPCLSRRSVVSTLAGVIYATDTGLVLLSPSGMIELTSVTFGRYAWANRYAPATIRACLADGKYFALYTLGGVAKGFTFSPERLEEGVVTFDGFTDGSNVVTDIWSGRAVLVQNSSIYELLPAIGTVRTAIWRSKEFHLPRPQNIAVGEVFYDGAPSPGRVRVLASRDNVMTVVYDQPLRGSGETFRLPSGFMSDIWQVEIESTALIQSCQLSTSARELKAA